MENIDYKFEFKTKLAQQFDEREMENLWRIVYEDLFVEHGFDRLNEVVSQLLRGKPVQYITGIQFFYGKKFYVNQDVLIPRPETEELVEMVVSDLKEENLKILDLGTGSGCIPIIIKLKRPSWQVVGMDISSSAIEVAQRNADVLNADVEFRVGDMTNEADYPADLDVIVCNPPYVLNRDKNEMSNSVLDHEPHLALFVDDNDPLYFYREVILNAKNGADKNLYFYFEIHHAYADEMVVLCHTLGLSNVQVRQDLQGKDRMLKAAFVCE